MLWRYIILFGKVVEICRYLREKISYLPQARVIHPDIDLDLEFEVLHLIAEVITLTSGFQQIHFQMWYVLGAGLEKCTSFDGILDCTP